MKRSFKVGFYVVFGVVNIGIFIFGVYNIKNIIKIYQYSESVNLLFYHTSNMNNAIQKYFLDDIGDPQYHKTNHSAALNDYDKFFTLVKNEADKITHAEVSKDFGINQQINTLLQSYINFDANFKKISNRYKFKGFIDYGMEGEMRKSVHTLEQKKDLLPLVYILKLRRSEKDYLLRKDAVYIHKLQDALGELKHYVDQQAFDKATKEELDKCLYDYEASFLSIVKTNEEIRSLQAQNISLMDAQINPMLGTIVLSIKIKKEKLIDNSIRDFIFLSLIFLASTLIIGYKINQHKNQHIEEIEQYLHNIIRCDFNSQELAAKLNASPSTRRLSIYLQRLESVVKRQDCCKPADVSAQKTLKASVFANVTTQNFTKLI
jgi:hypothetical protein